MQERPVICSIVGLCGTGKSVAAEFIERTFSFSRVYLGGFVVGEVQKRGLAITPENERAVREKLREDYGMAAMAQFALPYIRNHLSAGSSIVLDGLYSYSELILLRKNILQDFCVLAIHADKSLRHARLEKRKERPLTPSEVDARDHQEITTLEKGGPIAVADYHVLNNSTEAELFDAIRRVIETIRKDYRP